jgi:sugar O-acyltransferase, sialic acid O-acetyltransferase NeuD family
MKKLIIIGASGHGKVVADIAEKNRYEKIEFLDDDEKLQSCGKYPVLGKSKNIKEYEGDVIVAIGNAKIRQKIQGSIESHRLITLIHPDAVISDDVEIGIGSVVMAGAVINPGTVIGKGCIINTSSSIDHDCKLQDYVHISIGSHVAGTVEIGNCSWIGAGATVSNNVKICSNCVIGAGAVVVRDIKKAGIYIGIPARKTEREYK